MSQANYIKELKKEIQALILYIGNLYPIAITINMLHIAPEVKKCIKYFFFKLSFSFFSWTFNELKTSKTKIKTKKKTDK